MYRDIPFNGPLVEGGYFLEPEDLFGVKFNTIQEGWPIPLKFYTKLPVIESQNSLRKNLVIYEGYRPTDSYTLHKYYSAMRLYQFNIPKPMIQCVIITSQNNSNKVPERRPFLGMKPSLADVLNFDSKFENGNLDKVVLIAENEYDLYIRSDTNSKRHYSWFYFSVTKCKNKGVIRFNVVNMTDSPFLYNQGMKPVVSENRTDWEDVVMNVEYTPSKLNALVKQKNYKFWMLSFEFEFLEHEKLFFARSVPYTFSQLLKFIPQRNPYLKIGKLCKTMSGVNVPKLTITNFNTPKAFKKYILIVSRLNPGESVSSFITEGIVSFLLSENPEALKSREAFIYKIIPMGNPDGVIIGNSRCNLTGIQLHKSYKDITNIFTAVLKSIKKLAYKFQSSNGLHSYIELSGTFNYIGSHIYGLINPKDSSRTYLYKTFINQIYKLSPLTKFLYNDLESLQKKTPLQATLQRELCIETFFNETSVYGFKNDKGNNLHHDLELLRLHGEIIAESIYKYFIATKNPSDGFKIMYSKEKTLNYSESEDSDSYQSENKSENNLDVNKIIHDIMNKKYFPNNDIVIKSSSDEEDPQIKSFLLESIEEFSNLVYKKKNKKKITILTKIPEAKSIKKLTEISHPNNPPKKVKKIKIERKEISLNHIDMIRYCARKKNNSMPLLHKNLTKLTLKQPKFEKSNQHKCTTKNEKVPHMPAIPNLNNSKVSPSRSKYYKFGPFPNLRDLSFIIPFY
jgi:Cytosolic carboxypeptidase N-terminal domain/Zinc carboxypeptidase